jgi:hypothetical protein
MTRAVLGRIVRVAVAAGLTGYILWRSDPAAFDNRKRQRDMACWLWSQARPAAGTVVERYLREARGTNANAASPNPSCRRK